MVIVPFLRLFLHPLFDGYFTEHLSNLTEWPVFISSEPFRAIWTLYIMQRIILNVENFVMAKYTLGAFISRLNDMFI